MNILYLAHRMPYPPNKGDKLRAFRQIKKLSQHHDIWCACFVDYVGDRKYVNDLAKYCHRVEAVNLHKPLALLRGAAGWCTGSTITESFYHSSAMTRLIKRWCSETKFDAVVAFSSSMARYALSVATDRRVVDLCDLDSAKWTGYARESYFPLKQIYQTEGRRLARREADFIRRFDSAILITHAEAVQLHDIELQRRVRIVGNGVDAPHQPTQKPNERNKSTNHGSAALPPPIVGFIGTMDYRPNVEAVVWFVKHCWPSIRRAVPRVTFRIIGRNPSRRVCKLAHVPGVVVVGEVEKVDDELSAMTVSVAPLRLARGLQNKVLEAMAASKAIVLTEAAAEGIDAQSGEHFIVEDTPDLIAQHIIALIRDEQRRCELGIAARRFVLSHHNWATELEKFELLVTGSTTPKSSHPQKDRLADLTQAHDDALAIE